MKEACNHCGTPVPTYAKYCPKCGGTVEADTRLDRNSDPEPPVQGSLPPGQPRKRVRLIGAIVVTFVFLSALGYLSTDFHEADPQKRLRQFCAATSPELAAQYQKLEAATNYNEAEAALESMLKQRGIALDRIYNLQGGNVPGRIVNNAGWSSGKLFKFPVGRPTEFSLLTEKTNGYEYLVSVPFVGGTDVGPRGNSIPIWVTATMKLAVSDSLPAGKYICGIAVGNKRLKETIGSGHGRHDPDPFFHADGLIIGTWFSPNLNRSYGLTSSIYINHKLLLEILKGERMVYEYEG